MKCPKCGKDVILQKKQVGVDENGNPILNEYAICKDCKKQWNLDKQRAKKAVKKSDSAAGATASSTQRSRKFPSKKKPYLLQNGCVRLLNRQNFPKRNVLSLNTVKNAL